MDLCINRDEYIATKSEEGIYDRFLCRKDNRGCIIYSTYLTKDQPLKMGVRIETSYPVDSGVVYFEECADRTLKTILESEIKPGMIIREVKITDDYLKQFKKAIEYYDDIERTINAFPLDIPTGIYVCSYIDGTLRLLTDEETALLFNTLWDDVTKTFTKD